MRAVSMSVTLAVATLLSCWGCGSSSDAPFIAPTVPVKGKITYRGKALTKGQVDFEPTDTGRPAHGKINPDGTFVLSTFKEGDGAVVGTHRVSVTGADRTVRTAKITEVEVVEGSSEYAIELK